jgi:hypothetical protein
VEGGGIVDAVTGDGHDGSEPLAAFDDRQFLLGRNTGQNNFLPSSYTKLFSELMKGWQNKLARLTLL